MDFGLRDWLLVLGPVLIVGILAHGYWRMRANRHRIKMALDKNYTTKSGEGAAADDMALLRAELPNGGARIRTIPQQTSLDLEKEVPVLMDPVDEVSTFEFDEPIVAVREPVRSERVETARDKTARTNTARTNTARANTAQAKKEPVRSPVASDELPEKFVVIYVIAKNEPFRGQNLLESLVEQRMTYGEMNIFHRLDELDFPIFSLVNAIEPGTFDLMTMAELDTPGISLFMRVHELSDPVRVFNEMIQVAHALAKELGGEVKDQSQSVMTVQTMEHCRLEIIEYQHKHRK